MSVIIDTVDKIKHFIRVPLAGWFHHGLQMERQWLLLPPVPPPVVPRHGCRISWDLQQTPPDLVQQLPETRCLPVEQGPETVRPQDWHTWYGGRLLHQTLSGQRWEQQLEGKSMCTHQVYFCTCKKDTVFTASSFWPCSSRGSSALHIQ